MMRVAYGCTSNHCDSAESIDTKTECVFPAMSDKLLACLRRRLESQLVFSEFYICKKKRAIGRLAKTSPAGYLPLSSFPILRICVIS